MLTQSNSESDVLVRFSHRSLWTALVLVTLIGACAFVLTMFADSAAAEMAGRLAKLLSVAIVIAVVVLRSTGGKSAVPSSPEMKVVLNDELRQLSLARGFRNGLIAVLALQPVMALLIAYVPPSYPAALMASITASTGAAVVLASVLFYDR